MKKIVELLINVDDMEFDEMGAQIISIVDNPAIGVDFFAFADQELFVNPAAGETEDEFISRCIPVVIGEGYPDDQAAAICYSYWEDKDKFKTEEELQEHLLSFIDEYGEIYDPERTTIVDMSSSEFSTLEDITKAITALDILGKTGVKKDEGMQQRYRYAGPQDSGNRPFCSRMLRLNKLFTYEEVMDMQARLSLFGAPRGNQTYSVFQFKGGVNCRHAWHSVQVFKNEQNRVVLLDRGPVNAFNTMDDLSAAEAQNAGQAAAPSNNYWHQNRQNFSIVEEERILIGPAMVPNKLILRRDENGEPYHVYFSKDTVRKIAEKFIANGYQHNTDVNHDFNISDKNHLVETWIVEDPKMDKSALYGFDMPEGAWMVSYRVGDDEVWAKVKSGELRGFSITGDFISKATKS